MNNYQIYDEVGKGRFSSVYKGRRKKTIEYYAISSIDKSQRRRVLTNVKFLRTAQHQRVIKFHNWYETNNHLWVITELCTGGDMRQVLNHDNRLSEAAVRMFGGDIAEGLMYIHSRGVIYGDLKPSNVLMDSTMMMRFYDFGLSCDFSAARGEGKIGTPAYMAPELFTRDGVPSMASDLWAFGCLLFEMCTGKPPFDGVDLVSLITNIMSESFHRHEEISGGLNDLLESLLVKDPWKRATWSDVVASDFWQGRLQLPIAPFPPQPAFDETKPRGTGVSWPNSVEEVNRHVEWAVEGAKRNCAIAQSASEAGITKAFNIMDEVDLRDFNVSGEVATGDGTSNGTSGLASEQTDERRDSMGSVTHVNATQSQFQRKRERMRGENVGQTGENADNTDNKDRKLQAAVVGEGGLGNLRLDELLTHVSDAHIRPLVMNSRIERFIEQKYDPKTLGFEPPSKSGLKVLNEQQQARFITTVYRTLASPSLSYEEKLNVMCYFETVCMDASIANFIVNSSIMTLSLKMASQRNAPSNYRATAASIMSILVRHATFIHTDLAKANILSFIWNIYKGEESSRVKRKLAACLGELLIYIAVQQERDRAVWGIDSAAIFTMYMSVLSDADDVLKHYAVKTIENLASVSDQGVAMDIFAKSETILALLAIYALPPSSTRSEHMRSSAVCAALKLAMLQEDFIPLVLGSQHLKLESYGEILTAAVAPKAAQTLLTFINMALVKGLVGIQQPIAVQWGKEDAKSVFATSRLSRRRAQEVLVTIGSIAESAVSGLCDGSEHASVAMKGKTLLLFILLGCTDEQLFLKLCSSRHISYIDSIVRDRDSYVQRCAASLACYLGVFFEAKLVGMAQDVLPATTPAVLKVMYDILCTRNIGVMVEFRDGIFCSLGACLEKALSSARYAAYEAEFNGLVELLAQSCERILRHRVTVANELFPPYLNLLSTSNSERRFSSLRILSAFVAPLVDDSGMTTEKRVVEGEKLDHMLQRVAALLPKLLRESEPIPIHAIRLVATCGERRLKALAGVATVEFAGELVRYMVRSKQSDLSVPLRLLLLVLQTERAADLMDYLATQEFFTAVLLKTLTMVVAKELDHLLEPCCELAAFFLKHAAGNPNSQMARQCLHLMPPRGLETLWLPLCASPMRTAAENAALCVYYFTRLSLPAQQGLISSEGLNHVREIISDTRENPPAVLHVLRSIRHACERSRVRDVQKLSSWLMAALEAIAREKDCNKELSSEAAAIMELIRK